MTLNDIIVLESITSEKLIKSHYLIGYIVQKHGYIRNNVGKYIVIP